jgi:hypothetical protein
MRKAIAVATGLLIMGAFTVGAQEKAKSDKEEPKAKAGHETMAKKSAGASDAATIARAMSAGPPSVSKNATIMAVTADGKMNQLRAGTNGWMCMVDADRTPMCLDKDWQAWADGWINKKDPQVKGIGLAYMLKGDTGASNTDPYAKKATADNQWVVSGPHVMVISPDTAQLDTLPTDPWNGGPWVMWKGTKYAHIMMPTVPTPKPAAAKSAAAKPADKPAEKPADKK